MATSKTMRTALPDPRQTPRFAGLCTFCRFPQLAAVPREQQPVDWAIYGVPFDGGTTFRPGARFGPRAIREASQYVKPYHPIHTINIAEIFSLADAGDAPVKPFSCQENAKAVADFAAKTGDPSKTKLLAVGGDHSIAYANIRATWMRRGKPKGGLALIHMDAHLDTVDSVWDEKWSHASPFIRAIEDGLIDPKRMISIGVRGPLNSESDLDFARDKGVQVITAEQWRQDGMPQLASFIDALAGGECYLSFDIDCVDPAFAPGTGTPVCGGLTSAEAFEIIRACNRANLVGADIVEVLPDRDSAGITALLASELIFEILAASASGASGG